MKKDSITYLIKIPELLTEWDYEKNDPNLLPDKISTGSNRKVWWKCSKGHSWQDTVVRRTHGKKCPYCTNKRVLAGYNDLGTLYPQIA